MHHTSQVRLLKLRETDLADDIDRLNSDAAAPSPTQVCTTVNVTSYPTTAAAFYGVQPQTLLGAEVEGAAGTLDVDATTGYLAYVLGSTPPVAGDNLITEWVGHRWATSRGGTYSPGGVTVPGCPCVNTPATLTMVSSKPTSNNGILQSATFEYQDTPGCLNPLGIGAKAYLSTTTFTDETTGDSYWYNLTCYIGYYQLTRLYCESVYGSPYRDTVRYSWLVGLPGNSCAPFRLCCGQIFAGGDPSCVVTITGPGGSCTGVSCS